MKIIIVSWAGLKKTGGLEVITNYLYTIWHKAYEVIIIDFKMIKESSWMGFFLGIHYTLDALITSIYLRRYVKNIDKNNRVIITQGFNAPFVKADINYAHGTMRGLKVAMKGEKVKWKFHSRFERWAANQANIVIAVSESVKQQIVTYYKCNSEKIKVIPNCINTEIFYPISMREQRRDISILYCGRLEDGKGIKEIRSLALALEKEEHIKLLIATPTSQNTELFMGLKNTEIYRNLKAEDLNSYYNSGDVMFFPSVYEGFGLVIYECLASGIPVVGNNIPAFRTLVENDIEGVYLRGEETDLELLKRAALKYRNYEIKKIMHETIEKQFGMDIFEEKVQKLIKEYINNGKCND